MRNIYSNISKSRVPATGQVLLYAEATEAEAPFIESDLVLIRIQGQNAPPTVALMDKNALKFYHLLMTSKEYTSGSKECTSE
jgi:hypothetical protein